MISPRVVVGSEKPAAWFTQLKLPEPSVCRNCPFEPVLAGKIKLKFPASDGDLIVIVLAEPESLTTRLVPCNAPVTVALAPVRDPVAATDAALTEPVNVPVLPLIVP